MKFQKMSIVSVNVLIIFLIFPLSATEKITEKKTICLNMIVKDESDVIERCLNSVKKYIDYWVICDTGSTDGTPEIIKKSLKDIPGELHECAFVDFQTNRNEALIAAKGKGDYLLFIDADEMWVSLEKDFSLPPLILDGYYINTRSVGSVDFKKLSLCNNHLNWRWEGVIHETLVCKEAVHLGCIKEVMNLYNAEVENRKGARAKNLQATLSKDIATLKTALEKDPTNSRYVYYLAQCYAGVGETKLAKEGYDKRAAMPSHDVQETYASLYYSGVMSLQLQDDDEALKQFFAAYAFRPTRAEPLVQAAKIYRKKGNILLGYLLAQYALKHPLPENDCCVEYLTYDSGALIEFANCALLCEKNEEGLWACERLLNNPKLPQEYIPSVISNLNLAKRRINNASFKSSF